MSQTLIVLPDNTAKPILDAIHTARKSLRVKMFLFSHPELLKAVVLAKRRGVDVRVMLNPARRSGKSENALTHKRLQAAGIKVIDSNPAFDVTHEKSMVIDDQVAFIQSLNWDLKNMTGTREYAVMGPRARRCRVTGASRIGRAQPLMTSLPGLFVAMAMEEIASPGLLMIPSIPCFYRTSVIRMP
jgi:hypothetical protein